MQLKFALAGLALIVPMTPSAAGDAYGFRYAPMNIMGDGYRDKETRDGFLKIDAGISHRSRALAIDIAIYRAAELARQAGYSYVEIHDASERTTRFGSESVTLYAKPVASPVHPSACRSGRANRCYTADVEVVFARLSGDDRQQPGMAAVSRVDEFGRAVRQSGFGTGAVGGSGGGGSVVRTYQ